MELKSLFKFQLCRLQLRRQGHQPQERLEPRLKYYDLSDKTPNCDIVLSVVNKQKKQFLQNEKSQKLIE